MESAETFSFQGKEMEKQVKILTLACRFVPYDQWLVTHVDSSWTINEVKAWILAKCVGNNSSSNLATPNPNLPSINPPSKPKTKPARRPASPIVFAEFPPVDGASPRGPDQLANEDTSKQKKRRGKGRPISPITFAPIGGAEVGDEVRRKAYDPSKPPETEVEAIGMGYEEDDEWDSEEDSDLDDYELELDSKPPMGRRANRNQYLGFQDRLSVDQQTSVPPSVTSKAASKFNPDTISKGSQSTYHPHLLTLIRFSTGQILERHYTVQDYELKPYELLEVHRQGVITKLPREIALQYIEPYWEGWAKALRVVFRDPRFADARVQTWEKKRKDTPVEEKLKTAMDGAYMTKSPNPHTDSRRAMEILAGAPISAFAPADVALGLRLPSSRNPSKKVKQSVGGERDPLTSKRNESASQNDTSLGRSATISSSKPSASSSHHSRHKGGKFEWRERWVFIKDGVLHLKKENSESSSSTTQVLPLDSLTEIRSVEQLGRTGSSMPYSPNQRIVCAKFKARMTTTKFTASESLNTSSHARAASQGNIITSQMSVDVGPSKATKSGHSSKPSSATVTAVHSSSKLPSSSHPGNSSNLASRDITRRSASPPTKPQISLQIKPLSPPAPTPRVIQAKERTSSLNHDVLKDKGKGKAPAIPPSHLSSTTTKLVSESDAPSGPPSEATPSESPTDVEDDDDSARDGATQKKKKQRRKSTVSSLLTAEHKHPMISIESDESDGSGGTLSSPVFAHSEDDDSPFSDEPGMRSYGYGFGISERRKRRGGKAKERNGTGNQEEDEENVEAGTSYVVDETGADAKVKSTAQSAKAKDHSKRRLSSTSRHSGGRAKVDPDSEWVVLDLGDDFAFKSFLRVIHRHAPHVVESSFLSSLPTFQMPNHPSNGSYPSAPAPTPIFAPPFPSPHHLSSSALHNWSWNTVRQEQDRRPITEEISAVTPVIDKSNLSREVSPPGPDPSHSSPTLNTASEATSQSASSNLNSSSAGTQTPVAVPRESKQFRLPPSPTYERRHGAASSKSPRTSPVLSNPFGRRSKFIHSSLQKNSPWTLGALPYPEWRLEIVTKAQRAGMGELNRAMDHFLWGDNPGLALLSRDLGLKLAPMEIIRSPGVHAASGDRSSIGETGDGDSTEDAASIRKQRKRIQKRMTLKHENIAMGLDLSNGNAAGSSSSKTLAGSSQQDVHHSVTSTANNPVERSSTSTLSVVGASRSSLKLGYVGMDSSESGEESSDAEWLGWMADLHRQARLHREGDRLETASVGSSTSTNYWDYQQQDDHRRYQEGRKALEPSGVVTSMPSMPASPLSSNMQMPQISSISTTSEASVMPSGSQFPSTPSQVGAPSALTSPSSNESLGKFGGRRLSFGLSPSEPPSSATSPSLSQVGPSIEISHHKHEHISYRSHRHHRRHIDGLVRDGPHLSHSASTGLIGTSSDLAGASARELEANNTARRPSMPSLSSSSSTARSNDLLSSSLPMPSFGTASTSGPSSSGWPAELRSGTASTSLARTMALPSDQSTRTTMPRRSNTANDLAMYSMPSPFLSRSSSMQGKPPALLRKKDPESVKAKKELVQEEDREVSTKGKEEEKVWKGKERERDPNSSAVVQDFSGESKTHRPRLSLSMDNRLASTSGPMNPTPTSPTFAFAPKGRIHRIKSGPNLFTGGEEGTRSKSPPPKKKKNIVREKAEKLLQGLESTLDFVDAR